MAIIAITGPLEGTSVYSSIAQHTYTGSAGGYGSDGFYEGRDQLVDIDRLVFADQTVAFDDLL